MTTNLAARIAALGLFMTACGQPVAAPTPFQFGQPSVPPAGSCHQRGTPPDVLPDPTCTSGALNPDVRPDTIASTICKSGWTKTVRPSTDYTEPLKRRLMASYGDGGPPQAYELDHLISLELGGDPRAVANLWPEPGASPNPKDKVENAAHHAICSHSMSLTDAQHGIATDWIALGKQLGVA